MAVRKHTKIDDISEEKMQKEDDYFKSQAKELSELIVTEQFTVDCVEGFPQYNPWFEFAKVVHVLILGVSPDKKDVPVKELIFEGNSPVQAGNHISAKIPRYIESVPIHIAHLLYHNKQFYLDRDFDSKENAIELTILSNDGKILRTDYSLRNMKYNYEKYRSLVIKSNPLTRRL